MLNFTNINYKSLSKNRISEFRETVKHLNNVHNNDTTVQDYISSYIERKNISISINTNYKKFIPQFGSFIIVANHELGILDKLLLIKYLVAIRSDIKFIGDFEKTGTDLIDDFSIHFGHNNSQIDEINIELAKQYLIVGRPICIFPSKNENVFDFTKKKFTDKKWDSTLISFAQKANVQIIPVNIKQNRTNKNTFKILSPLFNDFLKKDKFISIKIGSPISVNEQKEFNSIDEFSRFLRMKTYLLNSKIDVKPFFKKRTRKTSQISEIQENQLETDILNEINSIKADYILFSKNNFDIFLVPTSKIPVIIKEIGILRETTFREIGEGTNNSIDLDEFDLYYQQLFIWDKTNQKIVGAYRVGMGKDIISQLGIGGFYINDLFKIKPQASKILEKSVELGRSFIVKEYQKHPLALYMLWEGILVFLLKNPHYNYLIGPVSISNNYSKTSKSILVSYLKQNYLDKEKSQLFSPKNKFKVKKDSTISTVIPNISKISIIDNIINDIENNSMKIPVMIKKYLKLNAKILGFNTDPLFNNALDGLIILELKKVPKDILDKLSTEVDKQNINIIFSN